jgi:hypothetical protein
MMLMPSASSDAAMIGSTEFFAPLMRTLPFSGLVSVIISLDKSFSPLSSFVFSWTACQYSVVMTGAASHM